MIQKKPRWLMQQIPRVGQFSSVDSLLGRLKLHTICESGRCPNISQCSPQGTAFLILGDACTRNCRFCAVSRQPPLPPDPDEPGNIVKAARTLKLNYVFITSVTRDDLPDGGASHFAQTIKLLHKEIPGIVVEVLIPDFNGSRECLKTVVDAGPEVIGHNMETVPRLYDKVRPMADYNLSLEVIRLVKELKPGIATKSGLMLGLGEQKKEVINVMQDLREAKCDLFTLGQYLAPSPEQYPVIRFVTPEEFSEYEPAGLSMGFKGIASAPLWRSSFKADELYYRAILGEPR